MSLCHKLWFSNPYIFGTQCLRPYLFQTKYSVRSNNLSLKYQRFTPSGSKDIGIQKFKFVTKALFLLFVSLQYKNFELWNSTEKNHKYLRPFCWILTFFSAFSLIFSYAWLLLFFFFVCYMIICTILKYLKETDTELF